MNLIRFYDSIEDYRRCRFRRMVYRVLRIINLILCFAFMVFMMITVRREWMIYGDYTAISFMASLVTYGTLSVMAYVVIDYVLRRIFKD